MEREVRGVPTAFRLLLTGEPEPSLIVNVTCETCGTRHRVERRAHRPEALWLICHTCEQMLLAQLPASWFTDPVKT